VYNLGGIPCKIDHGSIKNKLKWNQNVDINCKELYLNKNKIIYLILLK